MIDIGKLMEELFKPSPGVPCLDALGHLPWRLDGDPEQWPDHPAATSTDFAVRPVWTIDGEPVTLVMDTTSAANMAELARLSRQLEADQAAYSLRYPFVHDGREMTLKTDYSSGFDWNTTTPGRPPLIFESMIFANDGATAFGRCWRYATRTAATAGHHLLVATLAAR